jgi:hypothetical protein
MAPKDNLVGIFPSRVAVVIEPSVGGAVVDSIFLRRSCRQDAEYCVWPDRSSGLNAGGTGRLISQRRRKFDPIALAVFRTARYARRLSRGVCSRVRPTGPREIGTLAGLGEKKPGVTTQAVFVRLSFQEPR